MMVANRPFGLLARYPARLICFALSLIVFFALSPPLQAQSAVTATFERGEAARRENRRELEQVLKRHAQVLEAQAAVLKAVAKLIGPAVVHIEADVVAASSSRPSHRRHVEEAGSGVIIERGGEYFVLTNRHVIHNSRPAGISIKLADGRQLHPTKVWEDPATDIAVMAISAPNLTSAAIGDSDRIEIGDFVLAVGSPFGLSHSVTFGIISAKGRRDLELGDASIRFQDFIQTDAAINPGNSGGPLVNLRGKVIGINTAIASNSGGNEGIGFSIPINMFMIIGNQLLEQGKVMRAFLGVNLDSKFGPDMASSIGLPFPIGARITGVTKGSAAEKASLKAGDVIIEFNDVRIEDDAHLVNIVSLTEVDKKVPLLVFRDGKTFTVEVEVGDRSKFDPR